MLQDLGVQPTVFLRYQARVVASAERATSDVTSAIDLLSANGPLGAAFRLPRLLSVSRRLLGCDIEGLTMTGQCTDPTCEIDFADGHDHFIRRTLQCAKLHVLRDLKYKARIPIPGAWSLVGVLDEWGELEEGQIFASVREHVGGETQYISGRVCISRSPTMHPGDVRMVTAVGEPPSTSSLHGLTNVVVFSAKGARPLPSMVRLTLHLLCMSVTDE